MQIGQRIAERYLIQSLAGSGGMGKVYCAQDEHTGKQVAIKVLSLDASKYSRRFLREAKVMARLEHDNIVAYVDYGQTERGAPFIVMEWVKGEDLRQRMNRKKLGPQEAVDIIAGVGEALHFAHRHGVIHRDLKPSNLMLVDQSIEHIKLLDFGIARWRGPSIEKMTRTGISIGTPGYMAPEQSRGDSDIDGRADIYALGCVIYESLVGQRPFHGEDVVAVLARTAFDEPPRVSERREDISAEFDDLLADMMASNVERRPRNGTILSARARAIDSAISSSSKRHSLTTSEKELLCILLMEGSSISAPEPAEALQRAGGTLQILENGTNVITFRNPHGSAADLVVRAARYALEIRSLHPNAKIALATGHGETSGRRSLTKTIQSAAELLRTAETTDNTAGGIRVDQTTTRLLDGRFDIRSRPGDSSIGAGDLFDAQPPADLTVASLHRNTYGREPELRILHDLFHRCLGDKRAGAMLITGEPGMGKTHLCAEALARLQGTHPNLRIWHARGEALSKGSAFRLVHQLLWQAVGIGADDPLATRREKLVRTAARVLPGPAALRVAEFLGELCDTPFLASSGRIQLRAARGNAVLLGDQMRQAWEDFLAAVSRESPIVLVLDDLHWGDLPTIRLMEGALRRVGIGQWILLGIARPEIRETFPELWKEHGCQSLELGRLDEAACWELLGNTAHERDLKRMIRLSGGNAFYLEELARTFQATRHEEIPETILALAQARLRTLDAQPRRLLRAGSIFGRTFTEAGLQRLLGPQDPPEAIASPLQELVDREFLSIDTSVDHSRSDTSWQYSFRSELLRETAYSTLTDTDRELGHRLAARWLHETGVHDALLLAKHFEMARDKTSAATWYAVASRQALEGNDLGSVLTLAERGIAIGAAGAVLGRLHGCITGALLWTGENGRASEHSTMALEHLDVGSEDWARAAGDGVTVLGRCGAFDDIVALSTELVEASSTHGMSREIVSALARSASRLFLAGRHKEAEALFQELPAATDNWEETSDPVSRGHQLSALANRHLCQGDAGHFLSLSERSAVEFEACGDRRSAAITRVNVGFAYAELGDYRSAEVVLRSVLAVATRMELDAIGSLARNNLGHVLLSLGRIEEAWDLELVAIESFTIQGDDRMANGSRLYLSKIHQHKGALDLAYGEAMQALERTSTIATVRMQAHAQLASVLLDMERPLEALTSAKEAMRILRMLGQVDEGESFTRLILVEAEIQCMHTNDARDALQEAHTRLLERAEKIENTEWRQSFTNLVPDNARIFQLAAEWGIVD